MTLSVVIVTGLSGSGRTSILRALEDVGYEAVDNLPVTMLEEMITRGDQKLAVGIDARTRGFDANAVLTTLTRLRTNPRLHVQLVYAWADISTLLRRFTETRRRHPLAPQGVVTEGIAAEIVLTQPLREQADLVVDTTGLPIANLRRLIERLFGLGAVQAQMTISLVSFAYPHGLPQEADLVFDARFLRNPHYDPILKPMTGMDRQVGAYIEADPDFAKFFRCTVDLVGLVLPRFVQEGKKYATITIGCTGGRHRSVYLIETLADHLISRSLPAATGQGMGPSWRVFVTHRELAQSGEVDAFPIDRPVARRDETDLDTNAQGLSVQAEEA